MVAGMMHAVDTPCKARPTSINGVASPPTANTRSAEPTIEKTIPMRVTLTRPIRSASPPATTMNKPENRPASGAARDTTDSVMCCVPIESTTTVTKFPSVPAKSQ